MNYDSRGFAPTVSRQSRQPSTSLQPPAGDASVPLAITTLILAVVVNIMVFRKADLPIIRPMLGFWFVVVLPSYLLYATAVWRKCGVQERLGYSICGVLLILMLTGLGINELLPLVGVKRPLDPGPIVVASDAINISLYVFRRRYPDATIRLRVNFADLGKEEFRLLVGSVVAAVLAVFGANRLNNGASGHMTLLALALVALIGFFCVRWLQFIRESVMSLVIYVVSLSLLLTTSLRGWYVTGHDIQQEYQVFQLTEAHGHWSMAYFQNAYNACLSITILPTELGQIINVDNPYVYKLFFQLIFALCPVLAYAIARRYFNRGISTLAVAYFVSFPTFFTDMPFLNRQEIGVLFVAVGVLAATNPVWSFRRRQISFGVAGLGTEISHYSTMYVLVGTLIIALICSKVSRLFIRSEPRGTRSNPAQPAGQRGGRRWVPTARGAVTIGLIAGLIGIIVAWGTLATRTTGQVLSDGQQAITGGSLSIGNSFPVSSFSPQTVLNDLRQEGIQARAAAGQAAYLPWSAASKAATPVVAQQLTPLTAVGRELNSVGVPVSTLNSLARSLVAYGEEMFLAIGLVRLFISGRRQGRLVGGQFFWLPVGSTAMIVLITVLPSITADYGVLRAFQQGLLFFAPIIVIGSMTIFAWIGKYRARIAACAVCLGIFLATSTLVPQILGNNLAELNLNNSGSYYDLYYTTPQESDALTWLGGQPDVLNYPVQASWDARRFLFTGQNDVNGSEAILDEYPTLVLQDSWVVLGHSTTSSDEAISFEPSTGDIIEYKYPIGLLRDYKSLVYTDGGAVIYK